MESYTDFAEVYDELMDETPYEVWCSRLIRLMEEYGISKPISKEEESGLGDEARALLSERNLVLDLGCGTGTLTQMLARAGYDMIGVDLSYEMLQIAMDKQSKSEQNIMYLCQDMRNLELYCTVGTVISICDSLNYLLGDEDVIKTFQKVNNYLYPKGLFLFDFNTVYKYAEVIGDTTIAENREDCSFIWENFYDEESHINEYDLTVFVKEGEDTESFRRFQETHYQRGYTYEEMLGFVKEAGLTFVTAMDADSEGAVTAKTERVLMVCREKGK